ncbi:hypothetical protein PENANT_c212G08917, partial [Penicillium antarcticum]
FVQTPIQIGGWKGRIKVWILDLEDFDFVLGRDFLRTNNPRIDWVSSRMDLIDRQRVMHSVYDLGTPFRELETNEDPRLNLIPAKKARQTLRKKGTEAFLMIVRERKDPTLSDEVPQHSNPRVQGILERYRSVFRTSLPETLPPKRDTEHRVDTGEAPPMNINAYPLSTEKLDEQTRQVESLLKKGLIQPSSSPWGFPVIFVKKPNDAWRMCIDYRALNQRTVKNGYPLPRIQDQLDIVGRAKILTKIDLASGYWQIRMAADSVQKTAFNTIWGKYEWLAMPFGLCNAPATFQGIMNETLRPLLGKNVVVYLDDILVYSETIEEHYQHLENVLSLLQREQLYAQPSKCEIAVERLEFCGHVIGGGEVRPVPEKVEVIRSWPRPRNVHEVRQFLGLATYYRRYVHGFATIAAPLHELLKESDAELRKQRFRRITWTVACEAAFAKLKEALSSRPVLRQPDRHRPFTIETDASEWALGYVLLQEDEEGRLQPVAFDGRKMSSAELNYPYLDTTQVYSKRLARWIEEFQEHNLKIRYRKGSEAIVPDAISRRPDFVQEESAANSQVRPQWRARLAAMNKVGGTTEDDWLAATERFLEFGTTPTDPTLARAVERFADKLTFRRNPLPKGIGERSATVEAERELVFVNDDGSFTPYLPREVREETVMRYHHEFGHLGYTGLLGILSPRAWWPNRRSEVTEIVQRCPNCQVSQGSKESLERETSSHMVKKGIRPFERWGIDLIGALPKTPNGNRWIITAIDYATGWPVARAVPDATEEAIGQFLFEEIYVQYGAFEELISDNGPNLLAGAVRYFIGRLRAKHRTTTPYHPRTNGKVENFNGLIGRMLTKYLMGKPTRLWDEYLYQALFATRVREHSVTKQSPFFLVYGTTPRIPSDTDAVGPERDRDEQLRSLTHARSKANELLLNRAINTKRIKDDLVTKTSFEKDDWVLIRNESKQKFESRWFGPYQVLKAHPLGTYALAEPNGRVLKNLINGSRLFGAKVDNPTTLWTSSAARKALRRVGLSVSRPEEVRAIVEQDEPPIPTYAELSTITREEWDAIERSGVRSVKVGEGEVTNHLLVKGRRRKKKDTREETAPNEAQPSSDKWDSEANDYESDHDDDVEDDMTSDKRSEVSFDGPFAVVV